MLHHDASNKRPQPFLVLLVGTLIGVAVGLLMSPKSGRENREELKRKAKEMRDKVQQGRDKAMELADKAKRKAKDLTDEAADTTDGLEDE